MEPKTGKRIVSKEEYVSNVSNKRFVSTIGIGTILFGGSALVLAVWLMAPPIRWMIQHGDWQGIESIIFFLVLIGSLTACVIKFGRKAVLEAKQIDTGVPFTSANAADVPASDSLVRASSEPTQAPQAVLLRAAAQGVDTPVEEMLRASSGQE